MKGMVLGNSSYLDEEDLNLYRNLGISHLLAVSGLHIGIIAGSLIWVLSRLGVKRWLNIIFSVAILFVYGYSIGFPPSASRGIALFSMLYLSKLINRPVDRFNLLAGCMSLLQLYNPLWIFNSGFQLSFGATAAIILLSDRIKTLIYPLNGRIIDPVSATIAANLGIAPIQAYWFNSFPLLTLLSNIIIVPLASGCLVLGIASLMVSWLLPILEFLLDLQRNAAILIQRIPLDQIILPTPGIAGFVIYLTILAVFFNWRTVERLDLSIKKAIFVGLLTISIAQFLETTTNKELEIHFIDVGQGDSALIKGPFGNYMIDGGGSRLDDQDIGSRITLPYLLKNGVSRLEAVFVSHNHEDHYRGILPVIDQLSIGAVYTNGVFNKELHEKAEQRNVPIYELHNEIEADLGDGIVLKVLWPENNEYRYLNENENSLVFLLEYLGRRVLFTGDIEEIAEKKIGSSYDIDVDVLKVPHHGSLTSSSRQFLDKVKPEYSIISVGRNNLYGHPNPQVIDRLSEIGSEVHRTDEMGMIKVLISRNNLEVIPFDYERIRPSLAEAIREYYIELMVMALYLITSHYLVIDYIRRQGEMQWIN
jgi:competence protein ComEC